MNTQRTCYLFFDFDGTVTIPEKPAGRVPKEHVKALLHAKALGHKLILCTGRSWGYLQTSPTYRKIPWDGIIVGGAEIYWKGKRIFQRWMDPEDVRRLAEYAMRLSAIVTFEGTKTYRVLDFRGKKRPWFRYELEKGRSEIRHIVENDHITKMSILRCRSIIPPVRAEFLLHNRRFGEFGPEGCDKGKAIAWLCRYLGVPVSQCIVFGDSLNDLAMFQTVETSVSMAHAPRQLREAASYSAKGRFGVAEGISYYFDEH